MTRQRTASTRLATTHARRGAIFLITLATIVILAAMLLIFARNMRTEAVASANTLSATQADMIEQGAERWVLAVVEGTPGDSVTITETPAEALQVGTGYFWVLRPDPTTDQEYGFGITDEAGKLNLNTPNLTEAQLLNLPGMTTDVAEPILDWVSGPNAPAQTSGAKNDYYESLQEPYDAKNGAFETVDELSMVKGITPLILYGYDLNHDGVMDATEQSIAGLASAVNSGDTDTRGIFNYVTCYSRDANASATGASTGSTTTQKVAVNSGNFNQLQQALTTTLGQTRATAIIGQLQSRMRPGQPPPWSSLGQFFTASGMSPTEFGQVFPQLTTTQRARTPAQGLININTASAQALGCLPGLQRSDGDSLVASRGSANVNDVTWFFTALQTNAKVATVADWITTSSYFYSADIVAVAGDGRSFKRARIVVDSRTTPALIVYRKDLTSLGWPLPPEIRDDMRAGRPPRDAGAGAGGLGSGLGSGFGINSSNGMAR